MESHASEITLLLQQLGQDRKGAYDRLLPLVYGELRRVADSHLRQERSDHTLQATALVHEAYLKLIGQHDSAYGSRVQFLRVASMVMRRILIDHARRRSSDKRDPGGSRVILEDSAVAAPESGVDLLVLDESLSRLENLDARKVRIVEMRFFAGMTVNETADALEVSPATVKRQWDLAKLWLTRDLEQAKHEP